MITRYTITSRATTHRNPLKRYLSSGVGGAAERLRVAVVGGGCAGLSSALHLAPLVEKGLIASPIDVFDANSGTTGRDIGVGVWSTALDPFQHSDRESHQLVHREMAQTYGTFVGNVGYRIPSGKWLMKSRLPTTEEDSKSMNMPYLLFLREKDMLLSLQKACHLEEHKNTIKIHRDGNKTRVQGINESSSQSWSSELLFPHERLSERDYHLIIAADGTHSVLRSRYGGFDNVSPRLIGSSGLPTPIEMPQRETLDDSNWDFDRQKESVGIQDRMYTVFRGNSKITQEEVGPISFQTWGEGNSMRFATVPLLYPASQGKREERQVWFITINDDEIPNEPDPKLRQSLLLDMFSDWHDPIKAIVENTDPSEIIMERAIAHRHSMGPVMFMNTVIQKLTGHRPASSGEGPCVVFTGDAFMTIDPILAQGFTCAMEGAAALRTSVESGCTIFEQDPSLAFDPLKLRRELKHRHNSRLDRLVCLLRATELVQALGQPQGSSATGTFNKKILRPLTRLSPNFIKRPIFDAVLKYSLGLPTLK